MMHKSGLALAISAAIDVQRQASLDEKRRQFIASFSSGRVALVGGRRIGKTTAHRQWLRDRG